MKRVKSSGSAPMLRPWATPNELIHIYSGLELRKADTVIDEREIASVEKVPLEKLKSMIRERLILDGKTLLGLSLLRIIP